MVALVHGPRRDADARAISGEPLGDRFANPAAGAGHNHDLVIQLTTHSFSLRFASLATVRRIKERNRGVRRVPALAVERAARSAALAPFRGFKRSEQWTVELGPPARGPRCGPGCS